MSTKRDSRGMALGDFLNQENASGPQSGRMPPPDRTALVNRKAIANNVRFGKNPVAGASAPPQQFPKPTPANQQPAQSQPPAYLGQSGPRVFQPGQAAIGSWASSQTAVQPSQQERPGPVYQHSQQQQQQQQPLRSNLPYKAQNGQPFVRGDRESWDDQTIGSAYNSSLGANGTSSNEIEHANEDDQDATDEMESQSHSGATEPELEMDRTEDESENGHGDEHESGAAEYLGDEDGMDDLQFDLHQEEQLPRHSREREGRGHRAGSTSPNKRSDRRGEKRRHGEEAARRVQLPAQPLQGNGLMQPQSPLQSKSKSRPKTSRSKSDKRRHQSTDSNDPSESEERPKGVLDLAHRGPPRAPEEILQSSSTDDASEFSDSSPSPAVNGDGDATPRARRTKQIPTSKLPKRGATPPNTAASQPIQPPQPFLDYDITQLAKLKYADLASQPFDALPPTPGPPSNPPTQSVTQNFPDLTDRLKHFQRRPEGEQKQMFKELSLKEWEEAGDWFLGRFGDLMKDLKNARKEKRKVVGEFEDEMAKREERVRGGKEAMDKMLEDMRTGGETVLKRTGF